MRNLKFVAAVGTLCALGASGFVAVQSQIGAQAQAKATLTPADRLEIQELMHKYMFILDSCPDHNNGYDYADLYTEDGTFGTGNLKGRDALARAAGRTPDGKCSPIRQRGPMNQIHINLSPIIEATPDGGARGISYLLMVDGPANEIYWNGWYQDVYAKTPKGWRFKSRNHVGGARAGHNLDLATARMQWERTPSPEGSRPMVGKVPPPANPNTTIAGDPLRWLADGK